MRPDVTCAYLGRLGNTMFQTAAALGYATKHGLTWSAYPGYGYEEGRLNGYNDIYQFRGIPVTYESCHREIIYEHVLAGAAGGYVEIPAYPAGTAVELHGYFQSPKYFNHCANVVRALFKLPHYPTDRVSLHVRRGDFITTAHNRVLSMSYYKRAIELFRQDGHDRFLVCSDDIEWCARVMPLRIPGVDFEFCHETDLLNTLGRMASCVGHIMSNSTFSWWGAWLDPVPGRKVVTVDIKQWFSDAFADRYFNARDIYPPEWIQLPN